MASPAGNQYVHKACQQMGAWSGLNILVDSCVDFGYKNSIDQPPPTPADNMALQIIVGFGNVTLNLKHLGFFASPLLFHTLAAWFLSQPQVKMLLMLPMVQEWPDTWTAASVHYLWSSPTHTHINTNVQFRITTQWPTVQCHAGLSCILLDCKRNLEYPEGFQGSDDMQTAQRNAPANMKVWTKRQLR